jgi:hypothetical protein
MATTLQITNLTTRVIPVDSSISVPAGGTLTKAVTVRQAEEVGIKLAALATAGVITYDVIKSDDVDDRSEFVPASLEGGSCKWTTGYGTPNGTNLVPSAYANNGSGVVRVTVGSLGDPVIVTGSTVVIAGTTAGVYNGTWVAIVINATTIDLTGSTYSVNPVAKGTCTTSGKVGSIGDLFSCINGGASTTLWAKESGTATNAGWVGK